MQKYGLHIIHKEQNNGQVWLSSCWYSVTYYKKHFFPLNANVHNKVFILFCSTLYARKYGIVTWDSAKL